MYLNYAESRPNLSEANYQLSIKLGRARLYHFRALPPDFFNRFLIDFYPKDIKEVAAGGSWGVFIASQGYVDLDEDEL